MAVVHKNEKPCPQMLALAGILLLLTAAGHAAERPLFASEETLELAIEMPMRPLLKDAEDRPVVEGAVSYVDASGNTVTVPMQMTTRGHSRLETCQFPPLSMSLEDGGPPGTVFAGQDKLKLVTRCRRGATNERYLLQEYAIYKALNLLTAKSFRVRLLNVTYKDSERRVGTQQQGGFFIESDDEVAERLGLQKIDIKRIAPSQLEPAQENLVSLFQFFIGNTDWATSRGSDGGECCHNGKPLVPPGAETGWVVLPYDFDQAGLINTKYALPDERLRINSVRQRLFRGRCSNLGELDASISLFREQRASLETALVPEAIGARARKTALEYIDAFYDIINDPEQTQKMITSKCLGR